MEETKVLITDIVKNINFERRPRVSKQQKADFHALKQDVDSVARDLNKLRLRLWHAEYKSDYHSLNIGEALNIVKELRSRIDGILDKNT